MFFPEQGGHGMGGACGHINAFAFPHQTTSLAGQHASGENTTEAKIHSIKKLVNASRLSYVVTTVHNKS